MIPALLAFAMHAQTKDADPLGSESRSQVEAYFQTLDEMVDDDAMSVRLPELGPMATLHDVALTADGDFVAVGGRSGMLRVDRSGTIVMFAPDGRIRACRDLGGESTVPIAVAVAKDGRIAVTGSTRSSRFPHFPSRAPNRRVRLEADVFVVVFSKDLKQVEMSLTFGGGRMDYGSGIAFDRDGNLIVAGCTESVDRAEFLSPVASSTDGRARTDAFVVRIEAGAPKVIDFFPCGGRSAVLVACDSKGIVLAGGLVDGGPTPSRRYGPGGSGDMFLARYDATDHPRFLVAIGGSADEFADDEDLDQESGPQFSEMAEHGASGGGLAIDAQGRIVLASTTESLDFPTTDGAFQKRSRQVDGLGDGNEDGFIAVFDPEGALLHSTYVSTPSRDQICALALSKAGDIVVGGISDASAWITGVGATQRQIDGFVLRLDSELSRVRGSAGWAGVGYCWVDALAFDPADHLFAVVGAFGSKVDAIGFDHEKRAPVALGNAWRAFLHRFD